MSDAPFKSIKTMAPKGRKRVFSKNSLYHALKAHQAKQEAAKAREASITHHYDRATMRSVFRSLQRRLAGRWDGKPVAGGR